MKKFVAGFVVGSMIFGAAGAYAATNSNMIEVFYNVKNIKINKASNMPGDADSKPFIYNGTTFVPLRFVAEALGQPVKWDGSTQTVHIGQMEEETDVYIGNGIKTMNVKEGSGGLYDRFVNVYNGKVIERFGYGVNNSGLIPAFPGIDNTGKKYDNYFYVENFVVEYALNGQYKKFIATIAPMESTKTSKDECNIDILVDDKVVKTVSMKNGILPQDIQIDVQNGNKLTIKSNLGTRNSDPLVTGFFNARLTK